MDKHKSLTKILLAISLFCGILFLISFSFIINLLNLSFSYEFEQFWWFLMGSSLIGLFTIAIIFFSPDLKKRLKVSNQTEYSGKHIKKLLLFFKVSIQMGVFLIFIVILIYIYAKSFLSISEFELYITLSYPVAFLLYFILWIGIILVCISFILLFVVSYLKTKYSQFNDE